LADALKETTDFGRIVHIEYDSVAREMQEHQSLATATTADSNAVEVLNDESLEAWRSSRKVSLQRLEEELENHFEANDGTRLLVIMDDNFHLRSMRKDVYRTCQLSHAAVANSRLFFCIVWMDTPVDQCLERNRQRRPRIPDCIISGMSLESPNVQKACWEQGSIRLHACYDPSLVLQEIQENSHVVAPPLPPPPVDPERIEKERQKTRESALHQYDGCLRSWVGAVARIRRSDTGKANKTRKNILQKLRERQDTVDATLVVEWFLEVLVDWTEEETLQLKAAMQIDNK
jgi:tRNA uridine 5-carbamoylmethylation protein Kti12